MENDDIKEITRHTFLEDKKVEQYFADVDYLLRSGVHIQHDYPKPEGLFRFIDRNYKSLCLYYSELFNVTLSQGGSNFNNYFYIDFDEGTRGNISKDHRGYLKTEFIVIGMLFFKLFKLDGNIELNKVSDFIALIFSEYENEKEGLLKLIADSTTEKSSDFNDKRLEDTIMKAFNTFNDLGWIAWKNESEKDRFLYLPSFERLRNIYSPQIQGVDELIKNYKNVN